MDHKKKRINAHIIQCYATSNDSASQRQRYNYAALKDVWNQEEFKVTLSSTFMVL
ncbi:hypothetical protein DPMN_172536 [Dreissena polymorpha]|uniref:Uncharacterized protein n=1 Tax=Dreissena polymorpha TaxID=45954 RepID=A0A9D4E3V4_DREPO|nr:hypothetical protein DPMN_172536 [Dreissena polymorpha]